MSLLKGKYPSGVLFIIDYVKSCSEYNPASILADAASAAQVIWIMGKIPQGFLNLIHLLMLSYCWCIHTNGMLTVN